MPVRHAVEVGKRVEYFKGDKFCSFMVSKSDTIKGLGSLKNKEDAVEIGQALVQYGYIHRSERSKENKKVLEPTRDHTFTMDGYYTWMYDGPTTMRNILTGLMIVGALGATCFPIWPMGMKVAVWYICVTLLIFLTTFSIIRMVIFFVMWLCGYDFWILPNVFDDNLSVADSFKPMYSFIVTDTGEKKWRGLAFVMFIVFCVWVHNQPTDFDDYMELTKQFTEDIYTGKLLDDMSQKDKDTIDKVKMPTVEDLLKDDEQEHDFQKDEL